MADDKEGFSSKVQKQYGSYKVTVEIQYDPELDPRVELPYNPELLVGVRGSLMEMCDYILEIGKSFYDWKEELYTKEHVEKLRQMIKTKVYTDEELYQESLNEMEGKKHDNGGSKD